ncbi:MAG: hypothetical protein Roseis2KO_19520 [Roseivirga sp.]
MKKVILNYALMLVILLSSLVSIGIRESLGVEYGMPTLIPNDRETLYTAFMVLAIANLILVVRNSYKQEYLLVMGLSFLVWSEVAISFTGLGLILLTCASILFKSK